jgi:hypothetical protein
MSQVELFIEEIKRLLPIEKSVTVSINTDKYPDIPLKLREQFGDQITNEVIQFYSDGKGVLIRIVDNLHDRDYDGVSLIYGEQKKKQIKISYQGKWYDVTDFAHPGESCGIYLSDYEGKVIDEEIECSHMTQEPIDILEKAAKQGVYSGVKFISK